jgi:2-polyprenyl-6-methoxyphenol hydroxylase-like FAD-dependent oxidoreductase
MTEQPTKRPKTIVVGGGIGGCAAAIALAQAGADVTIFESASKLLEIGAGINVQAVAIGVLDRLGISEEMLKDPVLGDGIVTSKIEYYTADGVLIADESVGRAKGDAYPQFSLHRAKFHNTLIKKARELIGEDNVILDHAFTGMDRAEDGQITCHFEKSSARGEKWPPVTCDFLVGADGLKSNVRARLLGDGLPRYTGKTIYRGLCEVPALMSDGYTVELCGDEHASFICYPISEGLRTQGKTHCNWGFNVTRPEPAGIESWTSFVNVSDIQEELAAMNQNDFGGLTPLQIAQKTEKIIGWALFDRDPLDSFDFGTVTLLGDAAHPLLPYGSQGATQAIMDAEALGVAYKKAMAEGTGVRGAVKDYSDMRCAPSGKVVIANRDMGSTAVLREVRKKCDGLSRDEKAKWLDENGRSFFQDIIQAYRSSMPRSVGPKTN